MTKASRSNTTIDVLEGFFGQTPTGNDVTKLGPTEIEELGNRVRELASSIEGEPVPEGTMYPGGWVAGNWMWDSFSSDLNLALLYHSNVLVHDPLAEYFFDRHDWLPEMKTLSSASGGMTLLGGPSVWGTHQTWVRQRDDFDLARNTLASLVSRYAEFSSLVKANIMVPRSQWSTVLNSKDALLTSVRHDVRSAEMQAVVAAAEQAGDPLPIWDNLRGMKASPSGGFIPSHVPWASQYEFFHGAKNLAVASDAGATFMPQNEYELQLLGAKIKTALPLVPGREVLQEVARLLVPSGTLDVKTAVAIRSNDENYEDWRALLRNLERSSAGSTPEEIGERVRDELGPVARRIERTSRRSTRVKKAAKDASSAFVFSIPGAVLGAASIGGNPMGGIVGGAATGAIAWLRNSLAPSSLQGSDAVIASLMRSK